MGSHSREPPISSAHGRRLSHEGSLWERGFSGREAHEEADWASERARALSNLSLSSLMTLSLLLWFALPLLVLIALVDLATASESRRALILRRSGMSQTAIASRLGVSRYRIRQYLAA
jgi:hypothetical protein